MTAEQEKETLAAALNGNLKAFEALVVAYQDAVFSYVYNTTRNQMDAEELTQDVFVKAYTNLSKFRGDAKLKTWLFSIAHNTTASHYRKKEIPTTPADDAQHLLNDHTIIGDALGLVTSTERKKHLAAAMEKMAPQQRQLIQLFYLEELSIKEIEEITGLNEGSIKTGVMRGRNRLYALLKETLNDEIHTLL